MYLTSKGTYSVNIAFIRDSKFLGHLLLFILPESVLVYDLLPQFQPAVYFHLCQLRLRFILCLDDRLDHCLFNFYSFPKSLENFLHHGTCSPILGILVDACRVSHNLLDSLEPFLDFPMDCVDLVQ